MKQSVKNLLIASILGFVILGFLLIFMGLLASFVIAGMAEVFIYVYLKRNNQSESKDSKSETVELSKTEIANKTLLNANLQLRKTIISKELRAAYESLIDQLIELLPLVNGAEHTSELGWVINRMATEYLPNKSIKPYLALTESERLNDETVSIALKGIESMQKELLDVKTMVTNRKSDEFAKKAAFLKQRFTES